MTPSTEQRIKEEAEAYGIGPSSSPSDWQYIQKYFTAGAKRGYEIAMEEMKGEIERLKEYEFMYKSVSK